MNIEVNVEVNESSTSSVHLFFCSTVLLFNTMTIDSHTHFWIYDKVRDAWITDDMQVLAQNFFPENLSPLLSGNGIDGVIAVQADQSETETNFLVQLAQSNSLVKGVIGWIDLQGESIAERLRHFSQYKIIKGWRHIAQAEANDFLLSPKFQQGIQALGQYDWVYEILIYHYQLEAAIKLVEKFPEQRFVLDHCAKPNIREKELDTWRDNTRELARHPNVSCKISGLITEAVWKDWQPTDLYPYLDVVFEAFGADRLLFGSDWPVMLLAGNYTGWKQVLQQYMHQLSKEEQEKVFGGNAVEIYNLKA
ncbi:MAG TPA: amidohydrolase family protein [Chitinophagaceae bacterium]